MEAKRQAIIDLTRAGRSTKEISVALNVHRNTVNNVKTMYRESGDVKKRSTGSRRSVRTKETIKKVKNRINSNPRRSMRRMARDLGVSTTSMLRIVKEDLGATSRAITSTHLITEDSKNKRLCRARRLLNDIKHSSGRVILFSDEKLFVVDRILNRRNDRYISSKSVEDVPDHVKHVSKTKNPAKVMVLGVVASNGKKCPPVFIPQNERVNADAYIKLLTKHVLPWIKRTFPDGNYVWQQDGAPCHTAKKTQEFLKENLTNFWGKDMWPPNSPDLNPLDYSIWAYMEQEACKKPHPSVGALRASITRTWRKMDEAYVKKTCQSFRNRLESVIEKNGGIIE